MLPLGRQPTPSVLTQTSGKWIGQQIKALPMPHLPHGLQHSFCVGRDHISPTVINRTQTAPKRLEELPVRVVAFRHHHMQRQIPRSCTTENVGFGQQSQDASGTLLHNQLAKTCIAEAGQTGHPTLQQTRRPGASLRMHLPLDQRPTKRDGDSQQQTLQLDQLSQAEAT
ncbi:MAG: Uncharacterised protein [Cyanobium sp. ARS6]|nr:MAG: Uncharacterised protein [Cyanobium sp. ARS6]